MKKLALRGTGILLATLLLNSSVVAQPDVDEKCRRQIGPYYIYFTAFQTEPQYMGQKFCDALPIVGNVTLTIDYIDQAVRNMKTEVRIIQVDSWEAAVEGSKDAEAKTVLHLPAQAYPRGAVVLQHRFDQPGYYVELLTLESVGDAKYALRFPFQVGIGWGLLGITMVVMSIALVAGVVAYLYRRRSA